ncbi:autophagy-related protein 18f [Humulus lupulus]|uniref:autophagy-related protein 18f n=1 Tax=Humulus lupulus TaxID=3486 RepID=UPI002B4147B8|nr:autophagy-related protein 18f [Humulus lupulus]XP_062077819.1 autophagy-related protein 18f [Humulus lupulus]
MIKAYFEEPLVFLLWVSSVILKFFLLAMRNDGGQKQQGGGRTNGFIPSSFRALSSYLRIVSSGASTVAKSAASVASSIVDRDDDASHDQVNWAGFDKLEGEGDSIRRVLLLGYRSGFQVWDVEEADNVRDLVSRHGGPVSFMQMLCKPIASKRSEDKFADSRPLLVVCADGNLSVGNNIQDGLPTPHNTNIQNGHDSMNGNFEPTAAFFYSLRSQSYVYNIKFRSAVYSVRCSSRVVAITLATQIHCINASTLEREYTILTNPIVTGCPTPGGIGYGPLAVGPRWLAYTGCPVVAFNTGRVSPQHLSPSAGFPSNGSMVAHYAKESSKQLAVGIVTLGDMGYKKLSRYCSELLPDANNSHQLGSPGWKGNGTVNGHLTDADNVGMVIVKDIVSKAVIAQFRAHKSPISALCFDPSGTLLVTASVQGHNINVFKIMPGHAGSSSASDTASSYVHLYRLQRGFTNAVIQDISFSDDSNWIMISSSRGTNHLFAINPMGGSVIIPAADAIFTGKNNGLGAVGRSVSSWPSNSGLQIPNQQNLGPLGIPVTLSAVSRIKNGHSWRGTVSGAAAAATGRMSSLSGAVASSFHNCKGKALYMDCSSSRMKQHLLVFSPSGCMIQYALRISTGLDATTAVSGLNTTYESGQEHEARLMVEAIQKWNICQKQNRREREDNIDIYGDNGMTDSNKVYPEAAKKGNTTYPEAEGPGTKGKITLEEKHHLYISEAELQMHEARSPLWAKPEIYFQSMVMEDINMDKEIALGGEIEIERFPTRTFEARSKDLVPVFDYFQTIKYQKMRTPGIDNNINGRHLRQRSGASENGSLSHRSSSVSLDSLTDSGAVAVDLHNGIEETRCDGLQAPIGTERFVNTNDISKTTTQLETVNNRESLRMEAQLKFVNNNIEGLKMENHFDDDCDEVD